MTPEPPLIEANVRKWLEASTGSHWSFQPGWGIQYWKDGGLGLLVPDGQEGAATVSDLDLMAASQQLGRGWLEVKAELADLRKNITTESRAIEQVLAQALGFPWFMHDKKNFPTATEADGVAVGEHTPLSLAQTAAEELKKLWGVEFDNEGHMLLLSEIHAGLLDGSWTPERTATLGRILQAWRMPHDHHHALAENKRLKKERDVFHTNLDSTVSELIERWCTAGSGMDGADAAEALRDAMHDLAARLDAAGKS